MVWKRIVGLVPLVLLVSILCFALMHAIPGGPVGVLGQNSRIAPEDVAAMRRNFGLDDPLPVQYGKWLGRIVLHGDFGRSMVTGEPVLSMIARRLPATLELMGAAVGLALLVVFGGSWLSALKPRSRLEPLATIASFVLISTPLFWLGLVAMMVFSVELGWLPSSGRATVGAPFSFADHLAHLALPALVLAAVFVAGWMRYLRVSLDDVLASDFITTARAKGLAPGEVARRHALRSALPPVVTVVALNLPLLFSGSVVVETLFSWPGMGRLFHDGLLRMDYPRVMAVVFVSSVLIVTFNLVADLLYAVLDPRIRCAREG